MNHSLIGHSTDASSRPLAKLLSSCIVICALLVSGCGGGADAPDDGTGPIKVGAIFDLTGVTADVGTTYAEGLRGYVEWLNNSGGIDGREIDLLYQDYGYKVDQAEQLYSQFTQSGVVAFMGWGTGDTEALRGRIAEDEIPFMSASYSHVLGDPAEAPYNFLAGTSYSDQMFILLDWMVEQSETPPKVALMHHPSPFGKSPYEQGGREYAESLGIEIEAVEMARGATDFTAELTRINESGAKWVIFQNTSGPVAVALKNAQDLGHDIGFACLNWCSNEVLTELAGEAADGVLGSIIYSPPGDGITGLDDADTFLKGNGSSIAEKGLLYGQGWKTMELMMEGVKRAAASGTVDGKSVKAALETIQNLDTGGVSAPVSFSPTDHRGIKGMRIFQVSDGEWGPLTDLREPKGSV